MKALIEKRAKLMAKLDEHLEQDGEVRALDKEKLEEVDAMINEVKEIDAQIEKSKETRNLKNTKEMKVEEINMETRAMLLE